MFTLNLTLHIPYQACCRPVHRTPAFDLSRPTIPLPPLLRNTSLLPPLLRDTSPLPPPLRDRQVPCRLTVRLAPVTDGRKPGKANRDAGAICSRRCPALTTTLRRPCLSA